MRKNILLTILCVFALFIMVGCNFNNSIPNDNVNNPNGDVSEENSEQKQIYNLAVESGYKGTYEQWLASIRGDSIVLQVDKGYIQWKYSEERNWRVLISLKELTGAKGEDGIPAEFRVNDNFIQWRYVGESHNDWRNLLNLSNLTGVDGKDGKTPEFRVNDGFIQWKYTNESNWTNLISVSTVAGEKGEDGLTPEFKTNETHILWKYTVESDSQWRELIALDSLKGEQGPQGKPGEDGYVPAITIQNGNWYVDGVDTGIKAEGVNGVDGKGIESIERTLTEGLVDTYTITYTDGSKTTFTVTNGKDGVDGVGILDTVINANGELIIKFTNDSEINLGKVVGTNGINGVNGKDGVGIADVTLTEEGKLVITLTNKTVLDLGNIKGQNGSNGQDGKDGISIVKSEINELGELVLTYSNGNSVNLGKVVGSNGTNGTDGIDGKDGVGIANVTLTNEGNLIITLTNKTVLDLGNIKGQNGSNGQDGKDGISIVKSEINELGELVLTYSNGNSVNLGKVVGSNGTTGEAGVGIANVTVNENGHLVVTLTNNTVIDLGNIKGPQGEQGPQGEAGVGIEKVEYDENGNLVITFTNGTTQTVIMPEKQEHTHTFGEWTAFTDDDTPCERKLFFHVCNTCNIIEWKQGTNEDHDWEVITTAPTCQEQGFDTNTCSICGKVEIDNYKDIIDHSWSFEYSYDSSYHWIQCQICNDIKNREEHIEDEFGNCSTCSQPVAATEGIIYGLSSDGTYYEVVGYDGTATKVKISDTYNGLPVKTIYENAFSGNDSITSVIIPNSVESIGSYAFSGCFKITNVVIPDSVISIGNRAFAECYSLISIEIPNSVTSISDRAFFYCESLTSVLLGDALTDIGYNLFEWCWSLNNIIVSEGNKNYISIDGNLYTKDGKTLVQYSLGKNDTTFNIPNSVTSIRDYAFQWCQNLRCVVIPDSVTSIQDYAFALCSGLTSVVIPNSVTSIGEFAFDGCSSLTDVLIPDSVTSISGNAFNRCGKLIFTEYGNCKYLGNEENPNLALIGVKNPNYSTYTIHEDTKVIAAEAFYNCNRLSNIIIPDSVTSIGNYTFAYCNNITSITIPDGVTNIGEYAFYNCSNLTTINLGKSLTCIDEWMFYNCSKLTSVIIPNSVTAIKINAFLSNYTSAIMSVYYYGVMSEWSEILIDSGNYRLSEATRYYYSDSQPTEEGNYWHYNENGEVVVWEIHKHEEVVLEAVTPTCTTTGLTEGLKCSTCGEVLIEQEIVATLGHSEVVLEAVDPTCTETGLTEGLKCSTCNKILVEQQIIDALGHNFVEYQCDNCGEWDYTPVEYFEFSEWKGQYRIAPKKDINYPEVVVLPNYYNGNLVTEVLSFNEIYSRCDTSNIKVFIITDGYTSIVGSALPTSTTTVKLPSSIATIDNGDTTAFFEANSLQEIIIDENNATFMSVDGVLYSKDGSKLIHYPAAKPITKFVVPESVSIIGRNSFRESNLEEVVLNDNIIEIEARAFIYANIKCVNLLEGLTYIGEYTFDSCYNLIEIIIPDSVTQIDYSAFGYCESLKQVIVGYGVETIGERAFYDCEKLENVYYKGTAEDWLNITINSSGNDCLINAIFYYYCENEPTEEGNYWYYDEEGNIVTYFNEVSHSIGLEYTLLDNSTYEVSGIGICTDTEIVIPNKYKGKIVTRIGEYAFYDNKNITSVIIPEGVTSIGSHAFANCGFLKNIIIPEGVTSIGTCAFRYCFGLTKVELPKSLMIIDGFAFEDCIHLTSIVIPKSVTNIGYNAFNYCYSLTIYCEITSQPIKWNENFNPLNRPVYWLEQWGYDTNGNPVPLNN